MKLSFQNKLFLILITASILVSTGVQAKKKKETASTSSKETFATTSKTAHSTVPSSISSSAVAAQARINALSEDEKRLFDSLSKEQKETILKGKVDIGFNETMIKWGVGPPYYGTEHHPIFVDYEQVWLYTKPEIKQEVKEEQITDPQTHWPTIHRTIKKRVCTIGDYFLLFDRGVVEKIVPETERKVYGSCTEETLETFLPIVNGRVIDPKPVEPK